MILSQRQLDILDHILVNGQAWADNAIKEEHVIAKVAKYESAYDEAVAKGNYLNRKQRDEADAVAEQERYDNASYDIKRSREYPPATDYLDGVVKGDQAQIDQYVADCLAVKDKYPK